MFRKRLKWPKIAAISAALALLLAACSGGNNGNDDKGSASPSAKPSASASTSESQPAQEEEVTLKFYFGGDKKAATDEVWSAISDYVKGKGLNVKFDINFIPFNDFKEKMLVMSASGDDWDLNFDGDWLSYKLMAANGSYMALNDLLPKYAPTLYQKYQEQGTLGAATIDGKIVGLPWTMKMNNRQHATWRADKAAAAKLPFTKDSVKTLEDMENLLRELKKAYPNEEVSRSTPLAIAMIRDEWVDLNLYNLGFYMNDPKVKIQPAEQQPFFKDAAHIAKRWYDDGLLDRDAMFDKEDGAALWRNGKNLFTLTSHEWVNADPGFVDPSYKLESSLLYPDKKQVNRTALANVVAINRNSKHADRVLRFLEMVETDRALYDLLQYGIEGKTYVLNGEAAVYPEGMSTPTSNYMEWGGQWAFWKPQFMRPTQTYPKDFWVHEAEFASIPVNVNSPLDGLNIVEDPIKNQLAKRNQAIEEFAKRLEFGVEKDVDKALNSYIELQKKNGIDAIIAEVQKQVDAFLAAR